MTDAPNFSYVPMDRAVPEGFSYMPMGRAVPGDVVLVSGLWPFPIESIEETGKETMMVTFKSPPGSPFTYRLPFASDETHLVRRP